MKSLLLSALGCFGSLFLFGQDIKLSDSVIFIDNKPVAFYQQELINSANRYNVEVHNSNDDVLIKAEVIQFNAPVAELEPFFYYELIFPPTADTVSIYVKEEPFSMALAEIIRDYALINNNELNRRNLSRFKEENYGGQALELKIKYVEDYLNQSRYFYEQVARDRSKPVMILDNEDIVQDGIKIGTLSSLEKDSSAGLRIYQLRGNTLAARATVYGSRSFDPGPYNGPKYYGQTYTDYTVPYYFPQSSLYWEDSRGPRDWTRPYPFSTKNEGSAYGRYICLTSGRRIDYVNINNNRTREPQKKILKNRKLESEGNLYKLSKEANENISTFTDQFLLRVCSLIEDYSL